MTLQARELTCTRGERELFRSVALTLSAGDALRIAGNNGAGKSSLLRILCGLTMPTTGVVSWEGVDIRQSREQYCRQLTYIGHLSGIKDDLTACENVLMSARIAGIRLDQKAALAALERMGLGAQADLPARVLSQGQKKRVALTRLQYANVAPLWILDEPLAALDQDAQQHLTGMLNHHLELRGMLVYTTHSEISLRARKKLTVTLDARC